MFAFFSNAPLEFADIEGAIRRRLREVDVVNLRAIPLGRDDVVEASILISKE